MQTILKSALLSLCLLLAQSALADDASYTKAVNVFKQAGESGQFFKTAYGYALFPTIGKAGIGIGGAYGEGRVYAGGKQVGTTTMIQASIGLQLGGQAYSEIIFFQNQAAYEAFTSGNFEFGAEANVVAITAGASAEASTGGGAGAGASGGQNNADTVHGGYRKGMAVFTVAKGGLMYQVSVSGQKFSYAPL